MKVFSIEFSLNFKAVLYIRFYLFSAILILASINFNYWFGFSSYVDSSGYIWFYLFSVIFLWSLLTVILMVMKMEKVVKSYRARFIVTISELGESDPLLKNVRSVWWLWFANGMLLIHLHRFHFSRSLLKITAWLNF